MIVYYITLRLFPTNRCRIVSQLSYYIWHWSNRCERRLMQKLHSLDFAHRNLSLRQHNLADPTGYSIHCELFTVKVSLFLKAWHRSRTFSSLIGTLFRLAVLISPDFILVITSFGSVRFGSSWGYCLSGVALVIPEIRQKKGITIQLKKF